MRNMHSPLRGSIAGSPIKLGATPPMYRPGNSTSSVQLKSPPAAGALERRPLPRHFQEPVKFVQSSQILQPKGRLLTVKQATRLVDGQTYYCEITIDGGFNVKGKGADHLPEGWQTTISRQFGDYILPDDHPPKQKGWRWGRDIPHAEDAAIYHLITEQLEPLKNHDDHGTRWLSVTIGAAPCERCATNLVKLAKLFKRTLRVKASKITKEGKQGIKYLAEEKVPFRLWTEAQREASKRWGFGEYKTAAILADATAKKKPTAKKPDRSANTPAGVQKNRSAKTLDRAKKNIVDRWNRDEQTLTT
jgi:hypothetical protein